MKSYITVSVFGTHIEEFMNELLSKSVKLWNVQNNNGIIVFESSPRSYKKIARTAYAHGMRTKVEDRRGSYFKLRRYRKRYGAFFGTASFIGIIVFFSNFVWDIRVSGNEMISDYQIIEILEKHGLKIGARTDRGVIAGAKLAAALELDGLAWISIERDGSRINVKVSERLEVDEEEIPITSPCNVIAGKSGQIVEMEVYRGRLLMEKGWGVGQGEVIVSGVVEDGTGNIFLSHADAKIIAECVDETEFFISYVTREKKNNGNITKRNSVIFLGKAFPMFIDSGAIENASYSEETRTPALLGFKLPYRIKTGIYTHYDMVEVKKTQTDTIDKLKKQIEIYKENFYGDSEIISCDEIFIPGEEGIKAEIKIVYRTDIARKKIIGTP